MPKYRVSYTFNGIGVVDVEADTLEKAKEAFFHGQFSKELETGQDYEIDTIIKL